MKRLFLYVFIMIFGRADTRSGRLVEIRFLGIYRLKLIENESLDRIITISQLIPSPSLLDGI